MIAKSGPDLVSHVRAAKDAAKADTKKLSPSMRGIGSLLKKQLAQNDERDDEMFAELLTELARKKSGA